MAVIDHALAAALAQSTHDVLAVETLAEAGLCDVKVPELLPIPGDREVACHVAVRERTGHAEAVPV